MLFTENRLELLCLYADKGIKTKSYCIKHKRVIHRVLGVDCLGTCMVLHYLYYGMYINFFFISNLTAETTLLNKLKPSFSCGTL